MWFSVVCTLMDNDTRHHSGQNLLWTQGIARHINASSVVWDSYRQRQISQSDCEISSNCGKKSVMDSE